MLSEAMRASPTWLLQTPPANALLSFTFHGGRSCTRLEPRARAMNMLAAGAKDLRGRRSREAGIENLLYLKQAQELFKMSFEKFHTLSVVLDAASFRNAHILQIFAAALLDDAHPCGAASPPHILPELHCGGQSSYPDCTDWPAEQARRGASYVNMGGMCLLRGRRHGAENARRRCPCATAGREIAMSIDGPLDHRGCGGQVKMVMHLEGQEVIKTILNDGSLSLIACRHHRHLIHHHHANPPRASHERKLSYQATGCLYYLGCQIRAFVRLTFSWLLIKDIDWRFLQTHVTKSPT